MAGGRSVEQDWNIREVKAVEISVSVALWAPFSILDFIFITSDPFEQPAMGQRFNFQGIRGPG